MIKLGLVKGRHSMPVDDYVFLKDIKDVKDLKFLRETVREKLKLVDELDLYVSGLTVALVEVINYCIYLNIPLTLYHYDRESGTYYKQACSTDVHYTALREGGYV